MASVPAPPVVPPHILPRIDAQPIVDLASGELVREELLLRMVTGTGRAPASSSTLPGAERTGAITALDRLVVRAGAVAAAHGRPVSVNISGRSLGDPGFVEVVERAIAHHRVPCGGLMFEIAEAAAIPSVRSARAFAYRALDLGCTFALDDYGAGYAGLTYMDWFPFAAIKLDRCVVADIRGRRRQRSHAVVEAVVEVARDLGLLTIADGIDDARTLDALCALGVDQGQGLQFGPPRAFVPRASTDE